MTTILEEHIEHGEKDLRLYGQSEQRSSGNPDSARVNYRDQTKTAYAIGSAPVDMSTMRIVEKELVQDGPGWLHRCQLEGIADDATYIELEHVENEPEEGWDELGKRVYLTDPDALRWQKGARLQSDPITGISGEADDEKLTKADAFADVLTGQLAYFDFASGFTGLTSGTVYAIIKVDDSNIKLATTAANALAGTAINISADGTGGTLRPIVPGYEYLWITDRTKRKARGCEAALRLGLTGYYQLDLQFKGLKGSKPYKRRINGNIVTSVSRLNGIVYLTADRYEDFPPVDSGTNDELSGPDLEVEYDAASISVSDTYITTSPPPTEYVGQPWTPPDAPDVVVLVLTGEAMKYFFPYGWYCNSMPCEKIGVTGAEAWVVTVNYAFRVFRIPVTIG